MIILYTIFSLFIIFVSFYIIVTFLWFQGYEKPMTLMLCYLSKEVRDEEKFERNLKLINERRINIEKFGTHEEKIQYLNEQFPDYQMMTDTEVKEKYKGLDFSKVNILDSPCALYNIDEKRILRSMNMNDTHEVKDNVLQIKPGNRMVSVFEYSKVNIDELNLFDKIAIFRHKTPNFRYIVLDDIK